MATSQMSQEEAAALYEEKVRELMPDKAVEARLEEYRRDVERRSSGR
jgi:hypothetical protein